MEQDLESAYSTANTPVAKPQRAAAPAITAGETARVSLSGMRKVIAERLVSSLGPVPHFYLNVEINADALMRTSAGLK